MIKDCDTFLRMKCLYKHVDHMITISKYLKQYYSAYVKQIVEIPGVVADNYCVQNNYQNRDELINLCFVGVPGPNCCKEKIDWVIESICELNLIEDRFRFTIAGVGRDFFEKDCPNLVKHSLFDSSVKCLGRISHLECLELVASSDFSVIVREDTLLSNAGFPTKLGESFACGTPVLVTPTSNLEDYILHGYGFVADECSKASVFKLLKEISVLRKNEIKLMRDTVKSYNPLKARAFVEVMKEVLEDANN